MNAARGGLELVLLAPPPDSGPTGGTLYNVALIAALRALGVGCELRALEPGLGELARDAPEVVVLDSLHLPAAPEVERAARACGSRFVVLLHYLPSLVRLGRAPLSAELSAVERHALRLAQDLLVTSPFMREVIEQLALGSKPAFCIEPGLPAPPLRVPRTPRVGLRAAMLCSVVPDKGILPFLAALGAGLSLCDDFALRIAGRIDLDPEYVARCRELVAATPALATRVKLLGPLDHAKAIAMLADADVLVSASRMEAYGMALAEARALSVPIVARAGGHVAALVSAEHGGELVADERALASAVLALLRDPRLIEARRVRAACRPLERSWRTAASELRAWLAASAQPRA